MSEALTPSAKTRVKNGALAPSVKNGAFTPSAESEAFAPIVENGAFTPSAESEALTSSVENGALAPSVESEAPAPSAESEAPAPSVESEAPAPSAESEAPAPSAESAPNEANEASEVAPRRPSRKSEAVRLEIESLKYYEVLKPIPVIVRPLGERTFEAEVHELNISTTGSSIMGVFLSMKTQIVSIVDRYRGKKTLTAEEQRHLAAFENYIGNARRHWYAR